MRPEELRLGGSQEGPLLVSLGLRLMWSEGADAVILRSCDIVIVERRLEEEG